MRKPCVSLLVVVAILLGAATFLVSLPLASKPIRSPAVPVSLAWVPDQPGDGCPYSKPIFLVTNHTGKTVKVGIKVIETRRGEDWVPSSPAFPLASGDLHYSKQKLGTVGCNGLLGPHQADYGHVSARAVVLPSNAVWRVRASVSEKLVGGDKIVATVNSEPFLLAIRLRSGDTNLSVNPKHIKYFGRSVDVLSKEVVPSLGFTRVIWIASFVFGVAAGPHSRVFGNLLPHCIQKDVLQNT
jgi:hypothetical protein